MANTVYIILQVLRTTYNTALTNGKQPNYFKSQKNPEFSTDNTYFANQNSSLTFGQKVSSSSKSYIKACLTDSVSWLDDGTLWLALYHIHR